MRTFLSILTIGALGYGGLMLLLYFMQDRMLYLPSRTIRDTPGAHGWEYEEVWLDTEDGERLHAWWIPAALPRGALLFCHGNAGNISNRMESIDIFRRLGLSVLIFDYRGYGRSSGMPSEKGLYLDAEAAWGHLTSERTVLSSEVVVFGRSLGAGVATWLAVRYEPGVLVLESPFTSLADAAAVHYPIFPARLLVGPKYDNLSRIPHVRSPILINHATADEIIPFALGKRLYEAAPEPKSLTRLDGRHNDGFFTTGNRYIESMDRFLTEHLGRGQSRPAPSAPI